MSAKVRGVLGRNAEQVLCEVHDRGREVEESEKRLSGGHF